MYYKGNKHFDVIIYKVQVCAKADILKITWGVFFFVCLEPLPRLFRRALQKNKNGPLPKKLSAEPKKKNHNRNNMATNIMKCMMFEELLDESDASDGDYDDTNEENAPLLAALPFV